MLYIFKTANLNIFNLPIFCIYLSRSDLYEPCTPYLDEMRLDLTLGKFPIDFCPVATKQMFRDIDWEERIDQLDDLVSQQKNILFGTNRLEQFHYLKDRFKNNAFTISTSWDNNTKLTRWLSKYHVRMQELNLLELTEHDRDLRTKNVNLEDYYYQAFIDMNIVPTTAAPCGDYDIPLEDYFNPEKFLNHLSNINGNVSNETVNFYKQWLVKNS